MQRYFDEKTMEGHIVYEALSTATFDVSDDSESVSTSIRKLLIENSFVWQNIGFFCRAPTVFFFFITFCPLGSIRVGQKKKKKNLDGQVSLRPNLKVEGVYTI